jgi:N-acetylneuraminic acid mutarotase
MRPTLFTAGSALVLTTAACRGPTQVTVEVTTDVGCGDTPITGIAVAATGAAAESKPFASTSSACDAAGTVGSLVLVPSGGNSDELAVRVVLGHGGKSADQCIASGYGAGCIVARRELHYSPHTSLTVPVSMRSECDGVACSPGSTCVRGVCVSSVIPDVSACEGSGCGESVLPGAPTSISDAGTDGAGDVAVKDTGSGADSPVDSPVLTDTPIADAPVHGDAADVGVGLTSDGSGDWTTIAPMSHTRDTFPAVWAESTIVVWGGAANPGDCGYGYCDDGEAYDPDTDKWMTLPTAGLAGRIDHTMVWSGAEVIVWGGGASLDDGARYSPTKGGWQTMTPSTGTIAGRRQHVAVWSTTTSEMVVWGGVDSGGAYLATGGAYDPATDSWRAIAAANLSARIGASAVWNGTQMVVFGGFNDAGGLLSDADAYDPKTDTWHGTMPTGVSGREWPLGVATGTSGAVATFFTGGSANNNIAFNNGVTFNGKTWTAFSGPQIATFPRIESSVAWGRGRLWVWGGRSASSYTDYADGQSYDPVQMSWAPMKDLAASPPQERRGAATVWTGTDLVILGGIHDAPDGGPDTVALATGLRYRPK